MRAAAMLVLAMSLLLAAPLRAENAADQQWLLTTDRFGTPEYSILTVRDEGGHLTGDWDGEPVTGERRHREIKFTVHTQQGQVFRFDAAGDAASLRGRADYPDNNFPDRRLTFAFTARRIPDRPAGGPRTVHFEPNDFSNTFSAERLPVLTIWPGDTVHTSTIDSGGIDSKGATRALFGNPQTGPFFVAGARIGDTLAEAADLRQPGTDQQGGQPVGDPLQVGVGFQQPPAVPRRRVASGRTAGKHARHREDEAQQRADHERRLQKDHRHAKQGARIATLRQPKRDQHQNDENSEEASKGARHPA